MKKIFSFICLMCVFTVSLLAQQTFTLSQCRSFAIKSNKTLKISEKKVEASKHQHSSVRSNYFPKLNLSGGYFRNQKEMQLLSDEQQTALNNLGTKVGADLTSSLKQLIASNPQLLSNMTSEQIAQVTTIGSQLGTNLNNTLNTAGSKVVDAFKTDTRNVTFGALTLTQPIFMGGKIVAYNQITKYAEKIAEQQNDLALQNVILDVDKAYWQVVSLVNKKLLAESYLTLLQKFESDIIKLEQNGIATKADVLKVKVKENEAQLTLNKVDDGVVLSKMLLCQICGIDLNTIFNLADENLSDMEDEYNLENLDHNLSLTQIYQNRPETRALDLKQSIYEKKIVLSRSEMLPHMALVGNYLVSNPSVFNGFEKNFNGFWNVGITFSMPLFRWGENYHKIKQSKVENTQVELEIADIKEKIALQVEQSKFKVKEANKHYIMAKNSLKSAQENLRDANLGFKEGVIPTTDVLGAQTAQLAARSAVIDAKIEKKLTDIYLRKSLGIFEIEKNK